MFLFDADGPCFQWISSGQPHRQDLGQPEEEPRCAHILPVGPVGTPLPTAQFPEDEARDWR